MAHRDPLQRPIPRDPLPLTRLTGIPGVIVERYLGSGGMGLVYAGRHVERRRRLALKVAPRLPGQASSAVSSLVHEAQVMALLSHPHIVQLYDFGCHEDLVWIAMELIEGHSLRQLIHARHLSQIRALMLFRQLCEAVQHAHARGIIHQDLKPENVIVDRHDQAKIIDFGLAEMRGSSYTLARPGRISGTARYMAPERRTHPGSIDPRVDIYALGLVLYEMLTGQRPTRTNLTRLTLDRWIEPIIRGCIRRSPDDRWQTTGDLLMALDRIGVTHQEPEPLRYWADDSGIPAQEPEESDSSTTVAAEAGG